MRVCGAFLPSMWREAASSPPWSRRRYPRRTWMVRKRHSLAPRGWSPRRCSQSSDPEVRKRACAPYGASVSLCVFAGLDDSGGYSVFADMSSISCGGGGSPIADGMDAAGPQAASLMRIPDVESYEAAYPVLFLYRRLAKDSGGAGLHRGGVGLEAAWTPWGADRLIGITNAAAWQIPVPGIEGGYPGGATEQRRIRGPPADACLQRSIPRRAIPSKPRQKTSSSAAAKSGTCVIPAAAGGATPWIVILISWSTTYASAA